MQVQSGQFNQDRGNNDNSKCFFLSQVETFPLTGRGRRFRNYLKTAQTSLMVIMAGAHTCQLKRISVYFKVLTNVRGPLIVTPAKAGVQEVFEKPGFPPSRE